MQRKASKDKKDVKQLIKITKNRKRADLSKQFQEFKQRIQQFEDKNQEIINRIRDAYTYKKKNITSQQLPMPVDMQPYVIYYDRTNDNQSISSSCDYSKKVIYEGDVSRNIHQPNHEQKYYYQNGDQYQQNKTSQVKGGQESINQNQNQNQNIYNSSLKSSKLVAGNTNSPYGGIPKQQIRYQQYMRNIQSNKIRSQQEMNPQQMANNSKTDSHYEQKLTGKFMNQQQQQLQQRYNQLLHRNQILEEQLQAKQELAQRFKNMELKFKSYSGTLRKIVEDQLENYQEVFVMDRFTQIEKYLKKCDNKLKNMGFRLKDVIEDKKASKTIRRSREKRNSASRSKFNKNSSLSSIDMKESRQNIAKDLIPKMSRDNSQMKGKNRSIQNSSKTKQFQQIAVGYENMIKNKSEQNQKLQKQLREEMRLRQQTSSEMQKYKAILQEKQKELIDLKQVSRVVKDQVKEQGILLDNRQIKQLKEKIMKFEQQLRKKEIKQKQLNENLQKSQKSKKLMHEEYVQNINKNKNIKNITIQELQHKMKQIQTQYEKELNQVKDKLLAADKKNMERECEILVLNNKIKKMENELLVKEEKFKELESMLLGGNQHGDFLQKSMSIDNSLLSGTDAKVLQQNIKRLDEQIQQKNNTIYDLQKQKYIQQSSFKMLELQLDRANKSKTQLQVKFAQLQKELDSKKQDSNDRDLSRQIANKNGLIQQFETEREHMLEEKQEMLQKNKQIAQQLKKIKQQNLVNNRQIIKISSQINFTNAQFSALEQKQIKLKEQLTDVKNKYAQIIQVSNECELKFGQQIEKCNNQIQNLKNYILQIQTLNNKNPDEKEEQNLLNSLHVSQISFNFLSKKNNEEDIQLLREKLKEVEAALEVKTTMQQQVKEQYKNNLDKIRVEIVDKNRQIQQYKMEIEEMQEQLKNHKKEKKQDASFENYKISLYQEKIIQLQTEFNATKQSQERLNEMLHQIVQTMKSKEEEREKILKELQEKERQVEQLKEMLELKDVKDINKSMKDQYKQFSLRISGDQSQEMSQVNELSYLSNISDVFKRDDILQQKIKRGKTSRDEQVKLFAKTSAYIKSLKAIIQTKQKRIKLLEKQLLNMRSQQTSQWSNKNIDKKTQFERDYKTQNEGYNDDIQECDQFKDYDSVQLDTRRSKYSEIVKQLQHQKNLAVEQNKMLMNQIEILQDQILKSQQQEESLMKLKDLYKQQIKNLMEKNQRHTTEFEIQIQRQREEMQQSQSYHNWQALKQLFMKIIFAIAFLDDQSNKQGRKEEKRKQLEEYIKVMCSIMRLDVASRDKLLASVKK